MHTIRPNAARAKKLILVFIISVSITILQFPLLIYVCKMAQDVLNDGEPYDEATVLMIGNIATVAAFAQGIVNILLMVFFIQWFRRAYYNLRQIAGIQTSYTDGWAAGAWFVPFMNLVRPYKMMKELWIGTQNAAAHRLVNLTAPTLVGVWWALYLLYSIFGAVTVRFAANEDTWGATLTRTQFDIMTYLLSLPAALTAIMMVKRIHKVENELWEEAQTPSDSVFSLVPEAEQSISS